MALYCVELGVRVDYLGYLGGGLSKGAIWLRGSLVLFSNRQPYCKYNYKVPCFLCAEILTSWGLKIFGQDGMSAACFEQYL